MTHISSSAQKIADLDQWDHPNGFAGVVQVGTVIVRSEIQNTSEEMQSFIRAILYINTDCARCTYY